MWTLMDITLAVREKYWSRSQSVCCINISSFLIKIGGRRIIADAVPELARLIPCDEVLEKPLVVRETE